MIKNLFKKFFEIESSSGIVLLVATCLALFCENSPLQDQYHALLHLPIGFRIGGYAVENGLSHWVNDGLMAIFFFVVGMEIKREILRGHLASRSQLMLPLGGALGGMAIPAAIFYAFTHNDPIAVHGWAIPAATDIAFALGILTLAGDRVPTSLKVFLTALAILDDLGAIIIIALFYSHEIRMEMLFAAAGILGILWILNRKRIMRTSPYLLFGLLLWGYVLESGIHATIAGVLLALTIPLDPASPDDPSPLIRLEHALLPWVAFGIMPIFAFFNAGLSFEGLSLSALTEPVSAGIALGLFLGKQVGILCGVAITVALGLGRLPPSVRILQIYGVSVLAGIGFTMSLFIGALAYKSPELISETRLGVLAGSLLSAITGLIIMKLSLRPRTAP